jgi:hypothetical protein
LIVGVEADSLFSPKPCSAGTENWSGVSGFVPTAQVGQPVGAENSNWIADQDF